MTDPLRRCLAHKATRRGLVLVTQRALQDALACSTTTLRRNLAALQRAGEITILAPLPYLVLRLRSWSGKGQEGGRSRPIPYSYSKLSSNQLNESYRQSEGVNLMREILGTLGETDPATFEGAIKNFSPAVIRKALDRVRKTRSLRKNRTALFRYLLTKLS